MIGLDKFKKNVSGNVGIVMMLVATAVGILILAIVLTIGPVVGHNVENSVAVPYGSAAGNTGVANSWNANNSAILNGSEAWSQNTPLLGSAAIVVIASIIIAVLLGAFMLRRQG